MKVGILLAGALLGTVLAATPMRAMAAGAGNGARAAEVKDEFKELKDALKELKAAREAKDHAGVRASIAEVKRIWAELPEKAKERLRKKHPELAKRIEHIEHEAA